MIKYKIILPGQSINFTDKVSLVQHRAGINVTGGLDFETKKLFLIPRCGNTEPEDDPFPYGGRSRRNKPDYLERIRRIKQVSMTGGGGAFTGEGEDGLAGSPSFSWERK